MGRSTGPKGRSSGAASSAEARRIEVLIQAGLSLARSARTGRLALAKLAEAIEPEWIPEPLARELLPELAAAKGARDPLGAREVEKALEKAWGTAPASELDDLDLQPVAVTPTSQVHRATLEGEPVAVKLVPAGLAAALAQDLTLLDTLLAPLNAAFPALDAKAIVREVRERAVEELDLEYEAGLQRRFHRALRDHPFLSVPAPVPRLSRANVMVSAWADGTPLAETDESARGDAAAKLVLFVLGAARFGVMHADPDPRDVLVDASGGLTILDFGATRAVAPERAERWAQAIDAFAAGDREGLGAALDVLGWLPAAEGERALGLARHALGELGERGRSRLDSRAVVAVRERAFERPGDLVALLLAGSLPPEDAWPARGIAALFGTIARVGAEGDWLELVRRAASEGWEARP